MVDKLKFLLAGLAIVAGIAGFYLLDADAALLRGGAVLAGLVAAVVLVLTTGQGRQLAAFVRESIAEARKVVWPTRKETLQTTAMVFVFVLIMAIFLWLTDKTLEWVMIDLILGWKK
ncbi:MAG: preprotein translocase subunit SecE [Rhodocyclaceae bacterium]|jgi:preprotein translocase subunit SecE|nr:preprotein translocase subunit SecE [Rhodocyclaceae bacterium]